MSSEKSEAAKREESVLAFWLENKIFEKSLGKPAPRGDFIFYDGPPFANGLPHYGHILAGTIKDAIPRYRTMRGYRVPRQWGWDCHGLPVENLVEKELGFSTKRDIEGFGVAKFNEVARTSIMKDVADWKRIIPRVGRWADMERDYKTMDASYTESVWWAFKELWRKGLVEKSFKSMHLCPHCGTTLSNFEVSQGYKDIQDLAVTVKLELKDEPGTFLLAWTTTPWTLPGNMAAAVNPNLDYLKLSIEKLADNSAFPSMLQLSNLREGESYIASSSFWEKKGLEFEIANTKNVAHFDTQGASFTLSKVSAPIGADYQPVFSYYVGKDSGARKIWKVYPADFVNAEDGTGVVHIAPAFGDDDLQLAKREGLPIVHHVKTDGSFAPEVADFAGRQAKPKGNHQETDIEIIKNLAHRGLLFAKEKITHSYPHCWRCETPLLNYASTSWFVNVPAIKNKIVAENKKIGWVPKSVGEFRFGNWLEGAREWAISRSRFWGAPLPIWEAGDGSRICVASREELIAHMPKRNTFFAMRHGEAESNVKNLYSSSITAKNPLTENGLAHVRRSAQELKGKRIDLIVVSPFERTRKTAEIVRETLGLPGSAVIIEERFGEVQYGSFDGKTRLDHESEFRHSPVTFTSAPEGGETLAALKKRVGEALYELNRRYEGKNILVVSHGGPIWFMQSLARGLSNEEILSRRLELYPKNACVYDLPFVPLPVNAQYDVDYHRPYIDEVVLVDGAGKEHRRVPEVFDCWFESGAMPFASAHYPVSRDTFNPRRLFGLYPKGYPADFIAEGLDQTRGWFYSLIVLGVALFGRSPYKNVIVNGLVLAEDGQKMSKRLKNYPDPMDVVDQCGADAMRYYLLSSPVVRGEDLNFSLKGVQEVASRVVGRLANVLSFYELYAKGEAASRASTHVLDRWILSRLSQLVEDSTAGYEAYELDAATRPLSGFVDDLSVWYVRRSRERIKDGGGSAEAALATLRFVLKTVAHVMAPVMPFFADHVFRAVRGEGDAESVHLSEWPDAGAVDDSVLVRMRETRDFVSKGLEARDKAGIKVRQPLSSLSIPASLPAEYIALLREEVNVKEVFTGEDFLLDIEITEKLREEGIVRDALRLVQDARKAASLRPGERGSVSVVVPEDERHVVEKHLQDIERQTNTEVRLA